MSLSPIDIVIIGTVAFMLSLAIKEGIIDERRQCNGCVYAERCDSDKTGECQLSQAELANIERRLDNHQERNRT